MPLTSKKLAARYGSRQAPGPLAIPICLPGVRPHLAVEDGKRGVAEDERRHVLAAEADEAGNAFGGAVDPGALQPVEGPFRPVRQIMVLPHVFAPDLGEVADVAEHRIV